MNIWLRFNIQNKSKHLSFAIETTKETGELLIDNYGKIQELEWKLKTNFKKKLIDLIS